MAGAEEMLRQRARRSIRELAKTHFFLGTALEERSAATTRR